MFFLIKKYTSSQKASWDTFLKQSKNATFLFQRGFMEYHQDRFHDYSLMIYKDEKLIALLPANKVEDSIFSHQGFSYGGLLSSSDLKFRDTLNVFKSILEFQ